MDWNSKGGRLGVLGISAITRWFLLGSALLLLFAVDGAIAAGDRPKGQQWKIQGLRMALRDPSRDVELKALKVVSTLGEGSQSSECAEEVAGMFFTSKDPSLLASAISAYASLNGLNGDTRLRIQPFLSSQEPIVQAAALSALAKNPEAAKESLQSIREILRSFADAEESDSKVASDRNVVYAAARAFVAAAKPVDLAEAAQWSKESHSVRRALAVAVKANGKAGRAFLPLILDWLDTPDLSREDLEALDALMAFGDEAEVLGRVKALLNCPQPNTRAVVLRALAAPGAAAQPYVNDIAKLLMDPDPGPDLRIAAMNALKGAGDASRPFLPQIREFMKNPKFKSSAVTAYATICAKASLPQAVDLFSDPDPDVRAASVKAVGMSGEAAKPYLSQMALLLRDTNRTGSAQRGNLPLQMTLLSRDTNTTVRDAAAEGIAAAAASTRSFLPELSKLLDDSDPEIISVALRYLAKNGQAAEVYLERIFPLLSNPNPKVRQLALNAVVATGKQAKPDLRKRVSELLRDPEPGVRVAALRALGATRDLAEGDLQQLAELLGDSHRIFYPVGPVNFPFPDGTVRGATVEAIMALGPLSCNESIVLLNSCYNNVSLRSTCRFLAHYVGAGSPEVESLLSLIATEDSEPRKQISPSDYPWLFDLLSQSLRSKTSSLFQREVADRLADFTRLPRDWSIQDTSRLETARDNLVNAKLQNHAQILDFKIQEIKSHDQWHCRLKWGGRTLALHSGFWLLLIFLYPVSGMVQALFFWNPWVRRISGLGYVGFALTWIPFLRRRLLFPFRESLLADARLESFSEEAYYGKSTLLDETRNKEIDFSKAGPTFRKQVVIVGESGLGKSMLLRHLVRTRARTSVYLPAEKCAGGVLEAIQAKLIGQARDINFLRSLIWAGALDIYVDGLNEVAPDTRAKISDFAENYSRGNILMATQPMKWNPPSTAKVYKLLHLKEEQISEFLGKHEPFLSQDAPLRGKAYHEACEGFLSQALAQSVPRETREANMKVLSNPMDLTVLAEMIAREQKPEIFQLQRQQYETMAQEFSNTNQQGPFPLKPFAEAVYQMRLAGKPAIPSGEFLAEVDCMEKFKMVIGRTEKPGERVWFFRHDKVMDFFLVEAFLGPDNSRPAEHLADPRFRGVYFQLATLLPHEEAFSLREKLVQYAADSKDHSVSDTFIQLLRPRMPSVL